MPYTLGVHSIFPRSVCDCGHGGLQLLFIGSLGVVSGFGFTSCGVGGGSGRYREVEVDCGGL